MERRIKHYFLYRYPTPSRIEIYNELGQWELLENGAKPKLYDWYGLAKDIAKGKNAHLGEISELPALLDILEKLEKWKQAHKERRD
jgi:hypothetical protein